MKNLKVFILTSMMMFSVIGINSVRAQECIAILDTEFNGNSQLRAVTPTLPESNAAVTIDLLVVYTPAAKQWATQNGYNIDNLIDVAIQRSNLVFSNSQTGVTLNVTHKQEIDYVESSNSLSDDLFILRDSKDGKADDVHALRSQYDADLVVLLVGEVSVNGVLGIGFIPTDEWGNAKGGFSVTRVKTLSNDFTFPHELGHNFGCGHHTDVDYNALYNYAHGHRGITNQSNRFSTIMTYQNTTGIYYPHIPYFSDQNIVFEGVAVGSANTNNAKTIRQFKSVVATYSEEAKWIDSFLKAINISEGTLAPAFNPGIYNYTVNVPYHVTNIDIEGITNSSYATILSGNVQGMPLSVGNNIAEIEVEDSWGNFPRKYKITVTRSNISTGIDQTAGYSGKVNLSQNPAIAGESVTLIADLNTKLLDNATIEVFDLRGNIVSRTQTSERKTLVPVPNAKGVYLCVLKIKSGERYNMKMIVI